MHISDHIDTRCAAPKLETDCRSHYAGHQPMRRHARIAAPEQEMSLSIRSPLAAAVERTQAAGGPKRELTKAHRPAWPGLGLVSGSRRSQAYALHGSMHRCMVCNLPPSTHCKMWHAARRWSRPTQHDELIYGSTASHLLDRSSAGP